VIGRDPDVRGAVRDHAEYRSQDAANGGDLAAIRVERRWERMIMTEQLVGSVDEVNDQPAARG
jgi:hypothetical protein